MFSLASIGDTLSGINIGTCLSLNILGALMNLLKKFLKNIILFSSNYSYISILMKILTFITVYFKYY